MKRRVVLVHGLWWGSFSMKLLGRRLGAAGFNAVPFSYPSTRRSLAANAAALHDFAAGLEAEQLDLVGYSLGGLVVLRMLDEFEDVPPGRVVLLGSPVNGSAVAEKAAARRVFRPLVGQAGSALEAGFAHAPAGRETAVIAGTRPVGLGRLLGRMDDLGDGMVAADETRLEGALFRQMPVTHTGLITAPSVSRLVARFLQTGQFGD